MTSFVPHCNEHDAAMGLDPTHQSWRVHLQVSWAWHPAAVRNTHPGGSLDLSVGSESPQRGARAPRELGEGLVSLGPWADHKTWSVGHSWWGFCPSACPRQLLVQAGRRGPWHSHAECLELGDAVWGCVAGNESHTRIALITSQG